MAAYRTHSLEACRVWVMANKEPWAMGLMVGLTVPVTLCLASSEWTILAKLTALACFAAAATMYGLQNFEILIRFGWVTAISLFLLAVVIFRDATTFDSRILVWVPVFICVTFMATVNVAPNVAQALENTQFMLPIRISIGRLRGMQRETDVEQSPGRFEDDGVEPPVTYEDHFSASGESEGYHSPDESLDLNSIAPTTSSVQAVVRQINGSSGHGTQEPLNQTASLAETPRRSMLSESPPWSCPERMTRYSSTKLCSVATTSSSRQVEISEDT